MTVNPASIGPAVFAFLLAFAVVLLAGPKLIAWLRTQKFGQNINTDAPQSHQKKQGTPTMGGILIVLGTIVPLAVSAGRANPQLLAVLFVFLAHAALGGIDDWRKIKGGKSLGLKARQKLAGQIVIALAFVFWLALTARPNFTTVVTFGRGVSLDFGAAYYVLAALLMIGLSNATNVTDGLDGLAGGLTILTALGLAFTVYPAFDALPLFGYALAGACLGFLWFNAHPARVFMGDTGALAIGGGLTAFAVIGKQEILLLVLAFVFLIEVASVMIQVSYFKATGGKRVFRMTPIHHHFELAGWAETQVVVRFWIWGALALVVALWLAPRLSPWAGP